MKTKTKILLRFETPDCPVCLDFIIPQEKVIASPCNHVYCIKCIGKWLTESSHAACPLCKTKVKNIVYGINSNNSYSSIQFPKAFSTAWNLHKNALSLLDDYESSLRIMYEKFSKFQKNYYNQGILPYLIYSGEFIASIIGRETAKALNDDTEYEFRVDNCFEILSPCLSNSLSLFFEQPHLVKLLDQMKVINNFPKICNFIRQHIDPDRANILVCQLTSTMLTYYNKPHTICYSIETKSNKKYLTVIKNDKICNLELLAAVLVRLLMSFCVNPADVKEFYFRISQLTDYIRIIHHLFNAHQQPVDLNAFLASSFYYKLIFTDFYQKKQLKKPIMASLFPILRSITNPIAKLLKYILNTTQFDSLYDAAHRFKLKFIMVDYIEVDECDDDVDYEDEDDDKTITQENDVVNIDDDDDDDYDTVVENDDIYVNHNNSLSDEFCPREDVNIIDGSDNGEIRQVDASNVNEDDDDVQVTGIYVDMVRDDSDDDELEIVSVVIPEPLPSDLMDIDLMATSVSENIVNSETGENAIIYDNSMDIDENDEFDYTIISEFDLIPSTSFDLLPIESMEDSYDSSEINSQPKPKQSDFTIAALLDRKDDDNINEGSIN